MLPCVNQPPRLLGSVAAPSSWGAAATVSPVSGSAVSPFFSSGSDSNQSFLSSACVEADQARTARHVSPALIFDCVTRTPPVPAHPSARWPTQLLVLACLRQFPVVPRGGAPM